MRKICAWDFTRLVSREDFVQICKKLKLTNISAKLLLRMKSLKELTYGTDHTPVIIMV